MEKEQDYIDLLDCFLKGETSLEEEQILLEWFRRILPDIDLYEYYQSYWEKAKGKDLSAEVQGRMFHQIKSQINNKIKPAVKSRGKIYLWWSSVAAIIVLVLSLGLTVHYKQQLNLLADKTIIVSADKGQRSNMVLPDGTKVWLNSDTEIRYAGDYGKDNRHVFLSGEAYFDVAKDTVHRFIVQAGEMKVEALGTQFNVKAYEEDEKITTSLFKGKVRTTIGYRSNILNPDQSLCYNIKTHKVEIVKGNVEYNQMWRRDELVFKGENLEEIAVMMKRLYNVEVTFKSEEIKYNRFSGVIKNNSLQNVFELISLTSPIKYEKQDSVIVLSKRK